MTSIQGAKALAGTALLLAALTSCTNDSGKDPAAEANGTLSSPATTTATTTPPSASEVASEAASALLRQYFATVDNLRQQPAMPISELSAVATSTQLAAQKKLIQAQRSNGLRQTGSTMIAELTVRSVNLDNSDPKAGVVPTVQIDLCYDVSAVDILDADGESVVGPDRPDTGWIRFSVSNYKWTADPARAWRVASGTDLKQAPCAAS